MKPHLPRPFLDSDHWKEQCSLVRDERGMTRNPDGRGGWVFCKTDYLREVRQPFYGTIVTGHSSIPIDTSYTNIG